MEGFAVTKAHDGIEAVRAAKASEPDIILMDIGLPGIDGYEATRQIRDFAVGEKSSGHRGHRVGTSDRTRAEHVGGLRSSPRQAS